VIDTAAAAPSSLRLALVRCPGCSGDDAEPAAVGRDFTCDTSAESLLAVRCRACGLLYLNPSPTPASRDHLYPPSYFAGPERQVDRRRAVRVATRVAIEHCRGLPTSARLLEVAYGASLHVAHLRKRAPDSWTFEVATSHPNHAEAAQRLGVAAYLGPIGKPISASPPYDCVLLLHALEHCDSPSEALQAVSSLLRPGGQIVIVAHNVDSAASRTFQGRHWAGYDFPRHAVLFGPASLRRVAERADCVVERCRAVHFAHVWGRSAATLLADWSAPGWLRGGAQPDGILAAGLSAAAEAALGRGHRGAWMAVVLRRRRDARS
jgi:SAM-dependent methyltransferase